jgi:FG-GAP repeat/FG-GAP-like repeat
MSYGAHIPIRRTPFERPRRRMLFGALVCGLAIFCPGKTAFAQGGARLVADFNGDGIDDLAVGAPGDNGRGSVSIFFGRRGGFSTTEVTTPDLVRSVGYAGEDYGAALAAADFDRDGRSELAVGAPLWSNGRGRVEVLTFWPSGDFFYATGSSYVQGAYIGDRAEADDWFGFALTTGDFDGNGYPDLAVGVPHQDINGKVNAGAVHVIYARSGGLSATGNTVWTQDSWGIYDQAESEDLFGMAVAAGDINGDDIDDLVVGAPLETLVYLYQGAVNVIRGSSGGLTATNDHFLSISNGGQFSRAQLGNALATGDINGDGFADIAIGAPQGLDTVGFMAIAYGGPGGPSALFVHWQIVDPAEVGDQFGYSLAIGDFNRDGFGDVAVGAPGEEISGLLNVGAVTVFYGEPGFALNRQEIWHQNTYGVEDKIEARDLFGSALAVGDYNADGYPDLAIGVPWEDVGSIREAGAVNVILGTGAGLNAGADYLFLATNRGRLPPSSVAARADQNNARLSFPVGAARRSQPLIASAVDHDAGDPVKVHQIRVSGPNGASRREPPAGRHPRVHRSLSRRTTAPGQRAERREAHIARTEPSTPSPDRIARRQVVLRHRSDETRHGGSLQSGQDEALSSCSGRSDVRQPYSRLAFLTVAFT